jgi:hypothetical protein
MNLGPVGRYVAAALVAVAGFAQLFRSDTEVFLGLGYIAGALILAAATSRHNTYFVGVASGLIAVAFGARSLSSPWIGTDWHGAAIIAATWGGLALAFARSAWRAMRGVH